MKTIFLCILLILITTCSSLNYVNFLTRKIPKTKSNSNTELGKSEYDLLKETTCSLITKLYMEKNFKNISKDNGLSRTETSAAFDNIIRKVYDNCINNVTTHIMKSFAKNELEYDNLDMIKKLNLDISSLKKKDTFNPKYLQDKFGDLGLIEIKGQGSEEKVGKSFNFDKNMVIGGAIGLVVLLLIFGLCRKSSNSGVNSKKEKKKKKQ